jgi:hypothetical protein
MAKSAWRNEVLTTPALTAGSETMPIRAQGFIVAGVPRAFPVIPARIDRYEAPAEKRDFSTCQGQNGPS